MLDLLTRGAPLWMFLAFAIYTMLLTAIAMLKMYDLGRRHEWEQHQVWYCPQCEEDDG